jgi:nitroreductase
MNTLEAIARRSSCRAYKPEQIADDQLEKILKAGNAAPVGMAKYNTIKISVIQNRELIDKIDKEGMRFFARQGVEMEHPLYKAPTFILFSGNDGPMSLCNISCIIENMIIEAADLGIGSCYIMGNVAAVKGNAEIEKAVGMPEGFELCAGLIIGYPAEGPETRELTADKIPTEYFK